MLIGRIDKKKIHGTFPHATRCFNWMSTFLAKQTCLKSYLVCKLKLSMFPATRYLLEISRRQIRNYVISWLLFVTQLEYLRNFGDSGFPKQQNTCQKYCSEISAISHTTLVFEYIGNMETGNFYAALSASHFLIIFPSRAEVSEILFQQRMCANMLSANFILFAN